MRSAAADAEITLNKLNIDVALISEMAKSPMHGFQKYQAGRAAILVQYGIESRLLMSAGDTIAIRVGELNIVSTYWSPNEDVSRSIVDLDLIMRTCTGNKVAHRRRSKYSARTNCGSKKS